MIGPRGASREEAKQEMRGQAPSQHSNRRSEARIPQHHGDGASMQCAGPFQAPSFEAESHSQQP